MCPSGDSGLLAGLLGSCSTGDVFVAALVLLAMVLAGLVMVGSLVANVLGARAFLKRYTVELFKVSERTEPKASKPKGRGGITIPRGGVMLILVCFSVMAFCVIVMASVL